MLAAELGHHLRQERQQAPPGKRANHRNGSSAKTVLTPSGNLAWRIPRDR